MDYNLSKKIGEKWVNFGTVKKNQYGNLQASFRNTGELKELVLQGGEWINFSMFEKKDKPKEPQAVTPHSAAKADGYAPQAENPIANYVDDNIPFSLAALIAPTLALLVIGGVA